MKILFVIPYPRFFSQIANMGGHVTHVIGVVQAMIELGHAVTILTEETSDLLEGIVDDIVVVPCSASNPAGRLLWNRTFVKAAEQFRGKMDGAYVRYSVGFAPFISRLKGALGDCPLMLEVNSFLTQRKAFARFFEGRMLSAADHILTVSQRNRDQMVQYFGERVESKAFVVTNGVDLNRFEGWMDSNRREWNVPIVLGYAGIIKDWYGLDSMIDGFQRLKERMPNLCFRIYGDGPYRETLEAKYKDVDGLEFLGPQPFVNMPQVLSSIDVLINSATKQNAFQSPTKMFEYMASGRPIASARTPQCEMLLKDGELGALYELDDIESFVTVLSDVIADRDAACQRARAARSETESGHSWVAKCDSFMQVFMSGGQR